MAQYHIGTKDSCPIANLAVLGVSFPHVTGAPGGTQSPGAIVEMTEEKVAAVRKAFNAKEIRVHAGGAGICNVADNRNADGKIVRGPVILRCIPLSKAVYIDKVADELAPTSKQKSKQKAKSKE